MGLVEAGIMGMTTVLATLGYVFFIPFVIMYILEEIRGRRAGDRDPHLGAKLISVLFLSLAFQLMLAGFTAGVVALVDDHIGGETMTKNGIALLFGGAASGVLPLMMYRRIADDGHSRITRQALGVNTMLTGAVMSIAFVATSLAIVNEGRLAALVVVDVFYLIATIGLSRPLLAADAVQRAT